MKWVNATKFLPKVEDDGKPFLVYLPHTDTFDVYTWYADKECWIEEWYKKKRSDIKPKTWVSHWKNIERPEE